jgi:hypothetical protein
VADIQFVVLAGIQFAAVVDSLWVVLAGNPLPGNQFVVVVQTTVGAQDEPWTLAQETQEGTWASRLHLCSRKQDAWQCKTHQNRDCHPYQYRTNPCVFILGGLTLAHPGKKRFTLTKYAPNDSLASLKPRAHHEQYFLQ